TIQPFRALGTMNPARCRNAPGGPGPTRSVNPFSAERRARPPWSAALTRPMFRVTTTVGHRQASGATTGQIQSPAGVIPAGLFDLKPDDDLLSHGETPQYHRRRAVSLLSSGWDQVVHA